MGLRIFLIQKCQQKREAGRYLVWVKGPAFHDESGDSDYCAHSKTVVQPSKEKSTQAEPRGEVTLPDISAQHSPTCRENPPVCLSFTSSLTVQPSFFIQPRWNSIRQLKHSIRHIFAQSLTTARFAFYDHPFFIHASRINHQFASIHSVAKPAIYSIVIYWWYKFCGAPMWHGVPSYCPFAAFL